MSSSTGNAQDTGLSDSTPGSTGPSGAAGAMGVSSERVGLTDGGHVGTDGVRDTRPLPPDADPLPEQSRGGAEPHPDSPIPPVAGYNSRDPRHAEHPFRTGGPQSEAGV